MIEGLPDGVNPKFSECHEDPLPSLRRALLESSDTFSPALTPSFRVSELKSYPPATSGGQCQLSSMNAKQAAGSEASHTLWAGTSIVSGPSPAGESLLA